MKKIIVLLLALTLVLSSCFSGVSKDKTEEKSTSQSENKETSKSTSESASENTSQQNLDDLKDKELAKAVFEGRKNNSNTSYMVKYSAGVMEGGSYTTIVYKDNNNFRADNIDEAGFYEVNVYDPVKKLRYKWEYEEMASPDDGEINIYSGRIYEANSIKEDEIMQVPRIETYAKDDFAKLKNAKMDDLDGERVLYMELAVAEGDSRIEKVWYSPEKDFVMKAITTDEQGNDRGLLTVFELEIGGDYSDKMPIPTEIKFINTTLKGKELVENVYDSRPDNSDRSYKFDVSMSIKDSEGSFPTIYKNADGVFTKNMDYGGVYYKLYLNDIDETYLWYEGSNKGTKAQAEDRDRNGYSFVLENYADDNFARVTKAEIILGDGLETLYFEADPREGEPYKEQVWYSITLDYIFRRNEVSNGEVMSQVEVKGLDFYGDYSDKIRLPEGVDFEEENPSLALVRRVYNSRVPNPNRSFDFDYEIKFEDGNGSNSKGHLYYLNGDIRTEEDGDNIHEVRLYLKGSNKVYAWNMGSFDESGGEALNIEDSGSIINIDGFNLNELTGMPDFDELASRDFAGLLSAQMTIFREEEGVLYMEFENSEDNRLRDMIWYSPKKDLMLQTATVYDTGASVYFAEVYNESFSNGFVDFLKVPEDVVFDENQSGDSSDPKNLARKIYREMDKEQPFKITFTGTGLYAGQNDKSKFLIARDKNNKYIERQVIGEEGKSFLLSKVLDKVEYSWATIPNPPEAIRVQGKLNLSQTYPLEMMMLFANNDFADLKVCRMEEYKGQEVAYFESSNGLKISKMWFSLKDSMPLEIKSSTGKNLYRHLVTDSYEVGGDYSVYFQVPEDVKFTQAIKKNE